MSPFCVKAANGAQTRCSLVTIGGQRLWMECLMGDNPSENTRRVRAGIRGIRAMVAAGWVA